MKRIVFFSVIIISILTINSLVHSIYSLWKKQDLIIEAKKNLEIEKKRHEELKRQLSIVEKEEYIEQEARNKLLMVKPGEKLVIFSIDTAEVAGEKEQKKREIPNWKKWLGLFF